MKLILQVISVTVIENSSIATINNQGPSEIATPLVSQNQNWIEVLSKRFFKGATHNSTTIFDNWKPFKNDEKCFLFALKSSFRS